MIVSAGPDAFLDQAQSFPVMDVRSPGEFAQGHIPRAVNIPLFNNEERAVIGTLYKHSGAQAAIAKGLEIASPKVPEYLSKATALTPSGPLLVHCWRGGMRSGRMAELLDSNGFRVTLLTGGYKAYRRYVREQLSRPGRFVVLGGYTGSGKTEVLKGISRLGSQVLDLERLASHKGSAFGGLGQGPQPTNEQFENDLFDVLRRFDRSRPVWLEDESRMIGNVTLPDPVVSMISTGMLVLLMVPKTSRIRRLVNEYARFDPTLLASAVERISERLGRPRTREALDCIERGDLSLVADNVLTYYDKAYQHALDRRPEQPRISFEITEEPDDQTLLNLVSLVSEKMNHGNHLP